MRKCTRDCHAEQETLSMKEVEAELISPKSDLGQVLTSRLLKKAKAMELCEKLSRLCNKKYGIFALLFFILIKLRCKQMQHNATYLRKRQNRSV